MTKKRKQPNLRTTTSTGGGLGELRRGGYAKGKVKAASTTKKRKPKP